LCEWPEHEEAELPTVPVEDEEHEKEDMSLQVSSLPQPGQGTSSFEEKTICSNSIPHLLHLNS